MTPPHDADARRAVAPVICYPVETLPVPDMALYGQALEGAEVIETVLAAPREACSFRVRPEPLGAKRSVRTVLLRQNPRTAWHAYHHRTAHVEQFSHAAPYGDADP